MYRRGIRDRADAGAAERHPHPVFAETARLATIRRLRYPVNLAATGLIAAQAAWWASIALSGYFRRDDYFYIQGAHQTGLWDWLGRIYWEHFAPGHRLAFWLVGEATPARWDIVQLALVAAFAAGLVFFYWTLLLLYGRSWWLLVPLAVTGFAWQFSLAMSWPSAGFQIIPEFTFGTLCIYAFLRHLESRRWTWLALSVVAFTLGLAFYIRMLLVPVLLIAIRYLFLEHDLRPRGLARAFWSDRGRWVVFLLPAALYLSYFWQRHAFESPPPDSSGQVLDYLRIAWSQNVIPGFLGVRMGGANPALAPWQPAAGSQTWHTVVELVGQSLVVVLVAASVMRKGAAAMRAWAYVLSAVGVTFWLTARGKLGVGGAAVGYDARYVSNLCWQLPLGVVLALHPRAVLELGADWPGGEASPLARHPAAKLGIACAVAGTIGLAAQTGRAVEQDWKHDQPSAATTRY